MTEPRDGPVLIPGPFNLKKGGLLALRMLERTLASHRLSHAVIVRFDGDHPAADAALRHLSRSFCERIELLPTLASDDFHALLTRTSVILTCSLSEGFSNTVLEAIAAGNLACAPTSAIPPAIREHFGHKVYLFDPLSQDDQDRTLRQALLASPTQTGGDFRDVLRRLWEAEEDALRSAVE